MNETRQHIRLYVPAPLSPAAEVALSREQTHYLRNVMRCAVGDPIGLFNGSDGEWRAVIRMLGKQTCIIEADQQIQPQGQCPDLWLLCAPVKRARTELIAEKAAELGVREIHPVLTEYTNAPRVNVERLRAITIEAAEQCGLVSVPLVRPPQKLHSVLECWPQQRRILFCDESGAGGPALAKMRHCVTKAGSQAAPWAVLIGPEGGFSPHERAALHALPQSLAVSLGPRILRADTAAVAALSLWQSVFGDWGRAPV